jgi:peptide/nickel transport system substrate-binding protein
MKQSKWVFLVLAAVGLFSLSACKKTGSTALPVDAVFREDISSDLTGLNFLTDNERNQTEVLTRVYESLLDRDPETYELIPLLAKSYEVSKDGLSFTFELDEKAKWADGTAITSADVEFTVKTMFDPKVNSGVIKSFYGTLDPKVQVIDERRFVIRAKNRHFNNLSLASSFWILPKHLLETQDMNKGPILTQTFGSGPYVLDTWDKGNSITLKKNATYWGMHLKQNQSAYNFDKVQYRIVREPKIGIELLKQGVFSVFAFNSEQWERDSKDPKIQENYDTYEYVNKAPKGYSFVAWNNNNELFKSPKTRMALSQLMNRPFMIEKFTYGRARPAIGPIASTSEYAPTDIGPVKFDPAAAVEALKADGWKDSNSDGVLEKNGRSFEFSLMFSNPDTEKYLTVYKEDLAKAGVKMNLQRVDWTTFTKLLDERKFESVILAWTASVDPDLYQIWHSDSIKDNGSNFMSYRNKKVDELIIQAQREFDRSRRIALNQQIAKLIAAEAPYTFFLEQPVNFVAARKGIQRPKDFMNYSLGVNYWTRTQK